MSFAALSANKGLLVLSFCRVAIYASESGFEAIPLMLCEKSFAPTKLPCIAIAPVNSDLFRSEDPSPILP